MTTDFGIYVHIPFCEKKCKYCSFVSKCGNGKEIEKYFIALENQIKNFKTQNTISSVFFGGGTPSVVESKYICNILSLIKNKFNLSKNCEISIECNPNSSTKEKLENFKKAGFNRISFGVQSFDNSMLEFLGRVHKNEDVFTALQNAKDVGFENINIDILLGLKNNLDGFETNLEKCLALGVKHVSAYMLMLEENTPLFFEKQNTKILSDDESVLQYETLYKTLKNYGFERYEISNFALKTFECKHNQNYWNCGEYVGFGLSAHSYIGGERIANTNTFENFDNSLEFEKETISTSEQIEEIIMLGLRTKNGISISKLKALGYDILQNPNTQKLEKLELISIKNDNLCITENSFGLANKIIVELVPSY